MRDPAMPDAVLPSLSRKLAWAIAVLLLVATVAAAIWTVRAVQANRALAGVERSFARQALSSVEKGAPAAEPVLPAPAAQAAAGPVVAPGLPPRVPPGRQVPVAALRDLPEPGAAEVAPARTPLQVSGASGDESAAPAVQQTTPRQRQREIERQHAREDRRRAGAQGRSDRYGAVFARCPGPGVSGAVECRRAVCAGAARKSASCAPYLTDSRKTVEDFPAVPVHGELDRYGAVFARCPGPGVSGAVECRRAVCAGAARKSASCAPYLN